MKDKNTNQNINQKVIQEKETIKYMIALYCKHQHKDKPKNTDNLCPDCAELLDYAFTRIEKCPFKETKTFCNNCKVHCYRAEKREQIRSVMKFSGKLMLFHNPIMVFKHLYYTIKERNNNK